MAHPDPSTLVRCPNCMGTGQFGQHSDCRPCNGTGERPFSSLLPKDKAYYLSLKELPT